MALVSLADPGLTVFGYHRLLSNLGDPSARRPSATRSASTSRSTEVALDQLDPAGDEGIGVFGYIDAHHRQAYRLRLKDPSVLDREIPGVSQPFRELDAAILEALLLRGALAMSADDIEAKRGISYTASTKKAIASLDDGIRRRLPDAPDAGPAGPRRRRRRRDDAAEVDLLLPQAAHRDRLQPAE